MSQSNLLQLLLERLLEGDCLPQCDAFAELLSDFPSVKRSVRSQLRKRCAAVGHYRVDDDAIGDALGFLVVNLERGHSLANSIWRAAAWVAEGRRFVTSRDYGPLLGCVSVSHEVLTSGRYFCAESPQRFVFACSEADRLDAVADQSALEPWQAVAIDEETERAKQRKPGSIVLGEWLIDVYESEFGKFTESEPDPIDLLALLTV